MKCAFTATHPDFLLATRGQTNMDVENHDFQRWYIHKSTIFSSIFYIYGNVYHPVIKHGVLENGPSIVYVKTLARNLHLQGFSMAVFTRGYPRVFIPMGETSHLATEHRSIYAAELLFGQPSGGIAGHPLFASNLLWLCSENDQMTSSFLDSGPTE